jgi:predicted nucleotidyltransferase
MDTVSEAVRRLLLAAGSGDLDRLCERHGVSVLGVFGSAVRGGKDSAHDLDLAVSFVDPARADVLSFLDELPSISGPAEIDLMDLGRASPVAREQALVGGIPLYERERGDFARAQIAAMLQRMDTEWLRRLELELLAR